MNIQKYYSLFPSNRAELSYILTKITGLSKSQLFLDPEIPEMFHEKLITAVEKLKQ